MTTRSYERLSCPIAESLALLGDQWTLLIVRDAIFGLTRFEQFQQSLGISRNLLARRLKTLVETGLLECRPQQPGGRRNDYVATKKCRDLIPVLMALGQWQDKWSPHPDGPRVVPLDRTTGHPVRLRIRPADDHSGVKADAVVFSRRDNSEKAGG